MTAFHLLILIYDEPLSNLGFKFNLRRYSESPEQSYFNYVLVPTTAGHFRIHAMAAHEASNFITLDRGDDGAFGSTLMVTGSYCAGEAGAYTRSLLSST